MFSIPFVASGQTAPAYPIVTDRGGYSDGTTIIPVGHPQIEIGMSRLFESGFTASTYGEVTFRFATQSNLEFRITNCTFEQDSGTDSFCGWQDPGIGFKWLIQPGRFAPHHSRPEFSLEFSTSVPSGSPQFHAMGFQPIFKFIWEDEVANDITLGGNVVLQELDSPVSFPQFTESLYADKTFNNRFSSFAEVYRTDPLAYALPGEAFFDFGFDYLLNKKVQIDIEYGTSITGSQSIRTIGFGIAYRY